MGILQDLRKNVSKFADEGPIVEDYLTRIRSYSVALMGRGTYEFGYTYGMAVGANPYPWMKTHVVSTSLSLSSEASVKIVKSNLRETIDEARSEANGPVYLAGGGKLAGWMLNNCLIDMLVLKRAPIVLGSGTPVFAGAKQSPNLTLVEEKNYGAGYLMQIFKVA